MDKTGLLDKRRPKLIDLKNGGIALFPNDFKVTHTVGEIRAAIEADPEAAAESPSPFAVAGRMMAVNRFGKSAFIRFRDGTGQLQAYVRKDKVGDAAYDLFRQLDVGDLVGLTGGVFQTKTGEWTLLAESIRT